MVILMEYLLLSIPGSFIGGNNGKLEGKHRRSIHIARRDYGISHACGLCIFRAGNSKKQESG